MGKRVNCTKKERKEVLKELGKTEVEMQSYWDEVADMDFPNNKIRLLKDCGHNWTDLIPDQMRQLPTLKDKYLEHLAEKAKKDEEEQERKAKEEADEEYYREHFEEIMVKKIDAGERLTESELEALVKECNVIDSHYGDNRRWSRTVNSIVELCDRTFAIDWEEGLTEMQDDSFYNQPYEVELHEYPKTIIVKEWRKIG